LKILQAESFSSKTFTIRPETTLLNTVIESFDYSKLVAPAKK